MIVEFPNEFQNMKVGVTSGKKNKLAIHTMLPNSIEVVIHKKIEATKIEII